MLRPFSATPCPIPVLQRHDKQESIFTSIEDGDSTAKIEFTTAISHLGAGLKNTKPRRLAKVKRSVLEFAIHEDDEAGLGRNGPASAISQPPQRPKRNVISGPAVSTSASSTGAAEAVDSAKSTHAVHQITVNVSRRLSQAPRRPVASMETTSTKKAVSLPSLPEDSSSALPATTVSTIILKPARRGTIYIPTEDTTMPSMYMDLFSPIKDVNATRKASSTLAGPGSAGEALAGEPGLEITGIAAQMLAKKSGATAARKSVIAMFPKRGPLQVSARDLQESALIEDRWGQGGGKENVPPGQCAVGNKKGKAAMRTSAVDARSVRQAQQHTTAEARVSRLFESRASSAARISDPKTDQRPKMKPTWNAGPRSKTSQPMPLRTEAEKPNSTIDKTHTEEVPSRKPPVPTRFVVPNVKVQPVSGIYPVLTEDLANTSMYEENWLSHQEIAITQLINNLFESSKPSQDPVEVGMLRVRMLEKYGSPDSVMVYKRLQAALLYGALSVPSEVLKEATRLSSDLSKRKAFTDLWLETYDLSSLLSALEVVVGRECAKTPRNSCSNRSSTDDGCGVDRRALQAFIEMFLIRNEDGTPSDPSMDHVPWSYQRTILRSLMLINLLDSMQASKHQLHTSLFQPSSQLKSSANVIKALFQLLNQSAADPMRALGHLGYTVNHTQYPLEEYSYRIENVAVDLRDGVRLTRLVELLLYPSASTALERVHDAEATTTVLLPTGEMLPLRDGERDWPLSQYLHLPCHGRATKLHNVQVALSVLQGVKGMTVLVRDISAEDIVDGYREKTVRLLWALTSKWGLTSLVDWDDVELEIKRLCRSGNHYQDNDYFDTLDDEEGYGRHKILLKSWAQAISSQRGVVVKNMTTSFADGRVFEAVVDEYQGYLICNNQSMAGRPLCEKLRGLGCSDQFAQLFSLSHGSPSQPHLFDRDFVLAALAFLCSRLLGPSKNARAAATIQRAWRSYWARARHP